MSKTKHPFLKPCCEKFTCIANDYVDLCADADRSIRMLSTLLLSAENIDLFDAQTLREVGHTIDIFVNKQIVHQHYFFGRSLQTCMLNEADLGAELSRVHMKSKQMMENEL